MYRVIDYGSMLRDRRRIDAYTRALSAVLSPSAVVLDLGAGLGTFSILACRLGAARVYAVEAADVITVAEEHARANGVAERVRFVHARASAIELPEPVDVIVSDLGGALPLFEEHLPSVISVRDRFLKPGGVLIPQRDRLLCAPVSSAELYARIVEPWRAVPGLQLGAAEAMALNTPQAHLVAPRDLAGEPRCWAEIEYATVTTPNAHGAVEWTMDADREIHGIALWFESTLHDGVTYANGPWSEGSVHPTIVLPLLRPLPLRASETLRVTIDAVLALGHYVVTWSAGGQRQSSFLAEPRSAVSLREGVAAPAADVQGSLAEELTIRVSEQVLSRRVGPDLLLLDQATGIYHILNETGARVWEWLRGRVALGGNSVVVASKEQLSATVDDKTIIAGLQEGNYYGLNEVGGRVWQIVQSPVAAGEVVRTIAEEYEVSEEHCRADVLALLMRLASEGLIEVERAQRS